MFQNNNADPGPHEFACQISTAIRKTQETGEYTDYKTTVDQLKSYLESS